MIFRAITLQEANVFLPLIKDHFVKIQTLVAEGQALQDGPEQAKEAREAAAAIDGTISLQNYSPAPPKVTYRQKQRRLRQIESEIRGEVLEMHFYGAIVKSVFPARVDFLSELHRQPIYLCWQTGDKTVSHWHPIDEGFAGRRPIHHPQSFGPVVVH